MLTVSNLSVNFGNRNLFDWVTFSVGDTDKVGLIGRNGTGKSTLLKIIAGLYSPDEGGITKPADYTIGYLPQEGIVISDRNVYDEAMSAMTEIKSLESLIHRITEEIQNRNDYESKDYAALLDRLVHAQDRLRLIDGGKTDSEVEKILLGLGFAREEFFRPVSQFSGGWQMRIELAKILLRKPDIILLDEPTNHLDIESIRWLEDYLKSYNGSVMLVSHDSRFLDSVTARTIEIVKGKVYDLDLSYSEYMVARQTQKEAQLNAYKNQQRKIADTERFIERFRYKATLASRVQSRIKQLEKIETIEIDEDDNSAISLRFPEPPRSGRVVTELHHVTKRYGEKVVLDDIDFAIERGEKVAFVGRNGEGKSTLSIILAGLLEYEGIMRRGVNVQVGYYAQHQAEMLDSDSTVFETIDNVASGEMRTQVRSLLGAFLFSGEDVFKRVKVLSGGEKSRLALAKLLLLPTNFLILDEPTNHLDMKAREVLKNALINYKGALILVSHDRDFLSGLTNRTIDFKYGKLWEYPGGIDDFLRKKDLENLAHLEFKETEAKQEKIDTIRVQNAKETRLKQKTLQKEESRLRKKINECEEEITRIENRIAVLEEEFAGAEFMNDIGVSRSKQAEYVDLRNDLSNLIEDWENLNHDLESLQ